MSEEFLHFLWKYNLFKKESLFTQNNEKVIVLDLGVHNKNGGPDFFNARIKIGKTTWAGNIEMHLKSSDWYKHKHHVDKAYNSIILQVVHYNDKDIFRQNNQKIPTAEIKYDEKYLNKYNHLLKSKNWIPCEKEIVNIEEFVKLNWLTVLTIDRLKRKTEQIKQTFTINKNSWEETFYQHLARNFGLKLNADPFEWLAKSIPLKILAKHKNNLFQLEALLFGQAGFFEEDIEDEYFNNLKKEYIFLRKKYNLKPIEKHLWKFLRLRPSNFPTIRIAQFASLIFKSTRLFSKIIEAQNFSEIENLFHVQCLKYWDNHYVFGKISKKQKKALGNTTIHAIIINTIVPFLFFYGEMKGNEEFKDKAIFFLEKLPPENNSIIKNWSRLGFEIENSYITQALLQLKNEYCNNKKCLNCQIGNFIISKC
ncbi:MAG: DUF2851 family protein [Bacteroidales bacterium]|nr:DUF2851 family protein [Bacteroidales bacterium]